MFFLSLALHPPHSPVGWRLFSSLSSAKGRALALCGEARGAFIRLDCGAVHAASLFFYPLGVDPNGSQNFGRAVNV